MSMTLELLRFIAYADDVIDIYCFYLYQNTSLYMSSVLFRRLSSRIRQFYKETHLQKMAEKTLNARVSTGTNADRTTEYSDYNDSCAGINKQPDDFYLTIGDFSVFAWSISGIETTVVVRRISDRFTCCFDMGHTCRQNVNCDHVMISHGHMDHIAAVPHHMRKRSLMGKKVASYYVPPHLVTPLTEVCRQFSIVSENATELEKPNILAAKPGKKIPLNKAHYAVPFETVHRVRSQGYLVYRTIKQLKAEYMGLSGQEIGAHIQKGIQVHDIKNIPEVAFTGDTTFEVFTGEVYTPPPDLFKVKLLIVEATYIDDECSDNKTSRVQQARQWGHIHLSEIYKNSQMFRDVENILLIHMSDKYSVNYIQKKVFDNIPDDLKGKIHVATIAKERYL